MGLAGDDASIRAFAVRAALQSELGNYIIKFGDIRRHELFAGMSNSAIRVWLGARPNDYIVFGQFVLVLAAFREAQEESAPVTAKTGAAPVARAPVGAPTHPNPKGAARTDPLHCAVCGVRTTSQLDMAAHLRGQRHRAKAAAVVGSASAATQAAGTLPKDPLFCSICNVRTTSEWDMSTHLGGQKHQRALAAASPSDIWRAAAVTTAAARRPQVAGARKSPFCCQLCGIMCHAQTSLEQHLRSNRHALQQFGLLMRQGRMLTANTHNVHVSQLPDPLPPVAPGEAVAYTLTVTNLGAAAVSLRRVGLLQPLEGVTVHDSAGVAAASAGIGGGGAEVVLERGEAHSVTVLLAPTFMGLIRGVVLFDFGAFQIVRAISGSCATPEAAAEAEAAAAAAAAYPKRFRRRLEPVNTDIVPGEAPVGSERSATQPGGRSQLSRPVGQHPVPEWLRSLVEREQWKEMEKRLAGGRPGTAKSVRDYAERLKLLMWLEELQHEIDVRQYDMREVVLEEAKHSSRLWLKVPGLAENRPSVLRGDSLFVKPSDGSSRGREWEGVVHEVRQEEVLLGFAAGFRNGVWLSGRLFDVRFSVNRSLFNRLQAVLNRTAAGDLNPLLLLPGSPAAPQLPREQPGLPLAGPDADLLPRTPGSAPTRIAWTNVVKLNAEQRLAVREVLRGAHSPLPYIIFGPPGTGKTSTLVEAAVQVLRTDPASALLLVAPSNSAADQLFQRLRRGGRPLSEMMRVCAYTRPLEDLPSDMLPLQGTPQLNWDDGVGAFLLPSADRLADPRLRVVVATCATAAMLYHVGVPAGRFSHVLMDEAGHAEEPLALAGLAGLAGPRTRVVLAGDPQQLGPVILSPHARRHGMATSLLERLAAGPPYARREGQEPYLSTFITRLRDNYRSHPAILEVPNAAFYHGELRPAASPDLTHAVVRNRWSKEHLPNPSLPIVVHHIVGRDVQEAASPSWFNVEEIAQVKSYVDKLLTARGMGVTADDIGIISPYRRQVQRIRRVLANVARNIKVGSVEEFQGQERKVIIISTVRSDQQHLALDSRHRLGFLANPKRFNVAVTRAQALLVVVGNAQILATDPHWCALLRYAHERKATTGQAFPELPPLEQQEQANGGGGVYGSGHGDGSTEMAAVAAALQRLVLSSGVGAGDEGVEEADRQLSYLGGWLEVEGGEMRRLE